MSVNNKAIRPVYVETLAGMPNLIASNLGYVYYISNIKALWLYTGGPTGTGTTKPTLATGTVGTPGATYNEGSGKFFGLVSGITSASYSTLLSTDITNSTTTSKLVTGSVLRDNFYTKTEANTLLNGKLTAVAKGETSSRTLAYSGTFKVLQTLANGTVEERTLTLPSAVSIPSIMSVGDGLTGTDTAARTINAYNLKGIIQGLVPIIPPIMSVQEGIDGYYTDARTINANNLRGIIEDYISTNDSYLTGVTGSGNGTVTFTRRGLGSLTWDASHTHTIAQVTGLQSTLDGKADLPLASLRDFVDGTTIYTNIDYSQTYGAPFLLKIYGNTYSRLTPTETVIQGYIYNDTIINYGGYSVGNPITGLVALNVGGKLTFWFPRQGYWEGYFAEIYDVIGPGRKVNLVTSILDTTKPAGTKEVAFNNILNTVLSNDPSLTNARPASDVQSWAKSSQPSAANRFLTVYNNAASWRNQAQMRSDLGLGTLATWSTIALNDLTGVTFGGTPTAGQALVYGSGVWTNTTLGISSIDGLQAQLNGKQSTIGGTATSITSSNLTASRALVSNATGKVAASTVTATELGYVSGVTSNIQTQLNNKWKQIYAGTSSVLSKTATTSITVPSGVYAGKAVAIEIRYGYTSATGYTNQIVFVTLGTNSTTGAIKGVPGYIGFSEFDGQYLKNISTKCYVTTTGSTTSILFGYLKTLIGSFSGTTIDWTTQASETVNVYIGKIWLVE